MVTFADVENGKPHPEPYVTAAARLGYPAEDCLVVEDVPAGIKAGKAAGACVLAFTTTVGREELQSAGADFIARNCADLSVAGGEELTLSLRA
jgi:sugar-phosphatase